MAVFIANESGVPADEVALAGLARYVLASLAVDPLAELSVLLVDSPMMTSLHEQYTGEPGPTDVLAFDQDDLGSGGPAGGPELEGFPTLLGDVVVCPEVAAAQAADHGVPLAGELELLLTHGVLHLLGYDHAEPEEATEMTRLTDRLLDGWRKRDGGAPPGEVGEPGAPPGEPPSSTGPAVRT